MHFTLFFAVISGKIPYHHQEGRDMTGSKAPTFEVLPGGNQQAQLTEQQKRRLAQQRLIIWRLAQDNGINDELLHASGNSREQMQQFLSKNEDQYQEFRLQQFAAQLLSLEDLFEIGRIRLAEMLITVEKPGELKILLGALALLPGAKALLAKTRRQDSAAPASAVATANAEPSNPASDESSTRQSRHTAEKTVSASPGPSDQTLNLEVSASDCETLADPAAELQQLQARLQDPAISRQERRNLERQIEKLHGGV
jgi:hypothetical protein